MKYRDWHNRAVELSEKGMSKHHEMVGKIFPTNKQTCLSKKCKGFKRKRGKY